VAETPIRPELKLSNQLVMTAQLQLAIRMLQMKSSEFPIAQWREEYPALVELAPGAPDPIGEEERAMAEEDGQAVWEALEESPVPAILEIPDVFVFGNPPQARANRHAWPRWTTSDEHGPDKQREALWIVRALRQRARTFEKIVQVIADQRPLVAVTLDPDKIEPVPIRGIAETVGMHESTIDRVAQGCRFQNLHAIVAMVKKGKKLGFARL